MYGAKERKRGDSFVQWKHSRRTLQENRKLSNWQVATTLHVDDVMGLCSASGAHGWISSSRRNSLLYCNCFKQYDEVCSWGWTAFRRHATKGTQHGANLDLDYRPQHSLCPLCASWPPHSLLSKPATERQSWNLTKLTNGSHHKGDERRHLNMKATSQAMYIFGRVQKKDARQIGTSSTGIPAMTELGSSMAAELTVSLAPITKATSALAKSALISSICKNAANVILQLNSWCKFWRHAGWTLRRIVWDFASTRSLCSTLSRVASLIKIRRCWKLDLLEREHEI